MEPLRTELPSEQIPDSASSSRDRVLALVERVAGHPVEIVDDATEGPEPEYGCAACSGLGWLVYDVPRDHPKFGRTFPCECMGPFLANRELRRIFGAAQIPAEYEHATFETYRALPISGGQILASETIEGWATAGERSVLLWGDLGLGKTSLAVAAMRRRVELARCAALFVTTIDLLDAIRRTYGDSDVSEAEVLSSARTVPLLVLDDIGRERIQPGERGEWVRERLFAIVNHRQINHLATIYTSNKDIEELGEHLGDATAWRIKQACWPNVVNIVGTNLRALP